MIEIKEYVKAKSPEEAYRLNQDRSNMIIGGMMWTRMMNSSVNKAIDISGLGLNKIEDMGNAWKIGAMVTLRDIETHEGLNELTCGALRECVKSIVGVQFRNLATIGGSIYGRYGFSDVFTCFLALGAEVELFGEGVMSIDEFSDLKGKRDLLLSVILPKEKIQAAYISMRNTKTDFPVLTCCVVKNAEGIRCAIGGRPAKAVIVKDEKGILKEGVNEESAKAFGEYVKETVSMGSDVRAGGEYRSMISAVLVKRGLLKMNEV